MGVVLTHQLSYSDANITSASQNQVVEDEKFLAVISSIFSDNYFLNDYIATQ